jgi:hypothetical protein
MADYEEADENVSFRPGWERLPEETAPAWAAFQIQTVWERGYPRLLPRDCGEDTTVVPCGVHGELIGDASQKTYANPTRERASVNYLPDSQCITEKCATP